MDLTPRLKQVLQQKYGPDIKISVHSSEKNILLTHVTKSVARPKEVIPVMVYQTEVSRGIQYHLYELIHSVFDPK